MARHLRPHRRLFLSPLAAACWACLLPARAQELAAPAAPASASASLPTITVTGRAAPPASVSGWGDLPLAQTPVQATLFDSARFKDDGIHRLADLTRFDPAVSDAYNASGYYDYLTVRGYVIDNRFNFLRDGLPINAETSIPLDNKSRVEILKGTSGMQAGTSAPGGLVDLIVKRPLDTPLRSIGLEWEQAGTVTGTFDLSDRFGIDRAFGVRINGALAHLDPMVRDSRGNRKLFAVAGDWRVSPDTLLEAELEISHRSQPSQPGFSMLGKLVPPPSNPRLNLNDQPWSEPVVFNGTTASLRWTRQLGADWRFVAHGATQRLHTDDRLAFPFGCSTVPDGAQPYTDRYCPNGNFDLYDFRSNNERRREDALDLSFQGRFKTGAWVHTSSFGWLRTRVSNRFDAQTNNYVGTGNVNGELITPDNPLPNTTNTDRDEHNNEFYLRDSIALTERWTTWLGLRETHVSRDTIATDGSAPTHYTAAFTAPFAALSYAFAPGQIVYASWGKGVESNIVPNLPQYSDKNQVFTGLSRQTEIGLKGALDAWEWNLAAFDIKQPRTQDFGNCDGTADSCTTTPDGNQHHRGIEADLAWRQGPWVLSGGAQWLRARIEDSAVYGGRQPTNVPARSAKLQAAYDIPTLPGLNLQADLVHEGRRMVLPDNSVSIPSWTRIDAGLRYQSTLAGTRATWRAGVDNLLDRRAWRESPYEYSHVYLYPLAPRTFRLSLQLDL